MRRMSSVNLSGTVTRRLMCALAATALTVVIGSLIGSAQSGPAPASESTSPLVGEWILMSSDRPGSPSGIDIRRKTYTETTWSVVQKDPATDAVVFEHSGDYSMKGTDYTETVRSAGPSTAHLIGQTFMYRVTVADDTYSQVGGPWNETWKRAPREN